MAWCLQPRRDHHRLTQQHLPLPFREFSCRPRPLDKRSPRSPPPRPLMPRPPAPPWPTSSGRCGATRGRWRAAGQSAPAAAWPPSSGGSSWRRSGRGPRRRRRAQRRRVRCPSMRRARECDVALRGAAKGRTGLAASNKFPTVKEVRHEVYLRSHYLNSSCRVVGKHWVLTCNDSSTLWVPARCRLPPLVRHGPQVTRAGRRTRG